jgi:nitroimidazol reductase NimA-like FMN-containing flavoprotein (pyridoxamine 5'-phosphate oxidase superfamily)
VQLDRNGLEVLDRDECLRLLRSAPVGRLGFSSGALPAVLPVVFVLDGDRLLVRTVVGSALDTGLRDAVVALEADETQPATRTGWSVVVTGRASEVGAAEAGALDLAALRRWAPNGDGRLFAISLDLVSGRRLIPDA